MELEKEHRIMAIAPDSRAGEIFFAITKLLIFLVLFTRASKAPAGDTCIETWIHHTPQAPEGRHVHRNSNGRKWLSPLLFKQALSSYHFLKPQRHEDTEFFLFSVLLLCLRGKNELTL